MYILNLDLFFITVNVIFVGLQNHTYVCETLMLSVKVTVVTNAMCAQLEACVVTIAQ